MKKLLILVALVALVAAGCQAMRGTTASQTADDAYIVSAINGKILADPDLKFLQINVDSYNGNVSLSGRVPSAGAESKLINLARNTKGVKNVSANLILPGTTGSSYGGPSSTSVPGMGGQAERSSTGSTGSMTAPAPSTR